MFHHPIKMNLISFSNSNQIHIKNHILPKQKISIRLNRTKALKSNTKLEHNLLLFKDQVGIVKFKIKR